MNERYRLIRMFSHGGMAEVYLGVAAGAEGFEKQVAIKRVLPHLAEDEAVARMFLSEARLATHLSHQNIVQVFDVGRGPDGLFIVMELVNGWDLGVVIDRAEANNLTLPPSLTAFVASQALAGLCHAYRQTHDGQPIIVAHRDISPSNILVSSDGEVKVADFGIARLEASTSKTEPGIYKGKPPYIAPEVFQGKPASKASDQFALGIVLHEMLTGKHPFGTFDHPYAYADAIIRGSPADLPGIPGPLADIVRRALNKNPENRFETPEAFARALAHFLASTGTPSTTHELAEFTHGLAMPRLPGDLTAQDTLIRGSLPGSFSLKSLPSLEAARLERPPAPPAYDLDALQADWAPSGPTLDPSGHLDQPEPEHPRSRATSHRLPESLPLELAEKPQPGALDLSGRRDAGKAADAFPAPRKGRSIGRWIRWAIAMGMFAAAIVEGPRLYQLTTGKSLDLFPRSAAPLLRIESQPPGAKIHIGDQMIGETPMFIENLYPATQIGVKLSLRGYQNWEGKFAGGQEATISASLKRR